ncbi:MFS transporter [Limnochorda pilosa]|uniref:Major facilitator superfamily (MFS) profile domain-containing protein n=1 Tax=Limnochorda pilosa TaxID=1555112 RepID=A0A0K2SHS1_LIMPI|nr:MFS transporter [Limnochorda pilosa]BAS26646.1 hypothetical protein LIP_0789 [Limnochorda pilosa]
MEQSPQGPGAGARPAARPAGRPARPNRKAMHASLWDGIWSSASENAMLPFIPMFALALGAGPAAIGLVAAFPTLLGNLFQIPAARLAERFGHRRLYLLGSLGRLLWLPVALLPFLDLPADTAVALLIGLLSLRTAVISLAVPAWTTLMAQAVPLRLRGRYFSNRNLYASLSALLAAASGGWLVRLAGYPAGYAALFGVATLAGLLAVESVTRMPVEPLEPAHRPSHAPSSGPDHPPAEAAPQPHPPLSPGLHLGFGARLRAVTRAFRPDQPFSRYILTSFAWTFAVNLPAPLFAVHFKQVLGGNEAIWGLTTATNLTVTMIGQRYWGRRTVTLGDRNIVILGGLGASLLALLWAVIPAPWYVFGLELLGGMAWSGYNLAAFTLLLRVLPPHNQAGRVAAYNTAVGLAAGLAPMLGGFLVSFLGTRGMFLLSGTLRLVALAFFARAVQVPHTPPLRLGALRPQRGHLSRPLRLRPLWRPWIRPVR